MRIQLATSANILSGPGKPDARSVQAIRLYDPELSRRLDALFEEHFREARRPSRRVQVNHLFKRGLDITLAAIGLLLVWPVLLISGIATLCETGRPIFYSQMRRIRFGRQVRIYKMRTMYQGTDRNLNTLVDIKNNGLYLNVAKDQSSYTRVGRILEKLWIVELPQLWSVLKGEMSLVGNRPIPDYVIGVLGPNHEVVERFAGPQGMTGYTQVIGRDNVTDAERIRLEHHYSQIFEKGDVFVEDIRIIVITILVYLGLARRRCAMDFLPSGNAGPAGSGHAGPLAPNWTADCSSSITTPLGSVQAELSAGVARLACPVCYEVTAACDPRSCRQECTTSCKHAAIAIEDGRVVFNENCTSCSSCLHACPHDAIDKHSLQFTAGELRCGHCSSVYKQTDGVYDLLPKRQQIEQSPYFSFYESEYVGDNPSMHMEDTEWKLRELRPLIKRDVHYGNLLDLGCGAGVLGRRIATELHIPEMVSADWSTQILSVARRQNPRAIYARVDAAFLPFKNRSYGLAMLIDVIEHQHNPEQVLRELGRVANHLLLRTPLEDCWYESFRRRRKDLFRESSGHVVHYDPARIRSQLNNSGWEINRQNVKRIAWSHWYKVLTGRYPMSAKASVALRVALGWVLPIGIYRRLFVTNCNIYCQSRRFRPMDTTLPDKPDTVVVPTSGTRMTPDSMPYLKGIDQAGRTSKNEQSLRESMRS